MLKSRKRLASRIMKCSKKRVWLDPTMHDEIKEAINKFDIRVLIKEGVIKKKPSKNTSRSRARKRLVQQRKGRRKGKGTKKGKKTARLTKKRAWINKVRIMRSFLKELRDKEIISRLDYRRLYGKVKGGFFRSKRHIKLYIEEQNLAKK